MFARGERHAHARNRTGDGPCGQHGTGSAPGPTRGSAGRAEPQPVRAARAGACGRARRPTRAAQESDRAICAPLHRSHCQPPGCPTCARAHSHPFGHTTQMTATTSCSLFMSGSAVPMAPVLVRSRAGSRDRPVRGLRLFEEPRTCTCASGDGPYATTAGPRLPPVLVISSPATPQSQPVQPSTCPHATSTVRAPSRPDACPNAHAAQFSGGAPPGARLVPTLGFLHALGRGGDEVEVASGLTIRAWPQAGPIHLP